MKYGIDEQQIRLWWQIFKSPDRLAEIRLLAGKNIYSGYFKSVDCLITNIRYYLESSDNRNASLQAYCIFNDIDEALYSREQHDKFVYGTKTTKDDNITHCNFVLVDLDPERPAGISSSAGEFEKAHRKAVEIYRFLLSNGFSEPIICISGNGYHLYLPCDMPNDEEHHELRNNFLKSLGNMFADEFVGVDQTVGNAANLTKLMGTWAKKGADTQERPWRAARFVKVPHEVKVNETELFKKIADMIPPEQPSQPSQSQPKQNREPFDLVAWLNRYGINFKEERQGVSTKFMLEYCPWVDSHSDHKKWDSALFRDPDGKITFNCQHDHCKGKTWPDMRVLYEPDAYVNKQMPNSSASQPQQYVQRPQYIQKPRYEIKNEIPELGEKWLSMSAIKKVDLTQLEKVLTGCIELDHKIGGLYMSEVTILSGSNSSGKSSWLNTLLMNIIEQGYKVALWSGELRADILKTWIQMVAAGADNLKPSEFDNGRYYVPQMVGRRIDEWMDGRFFLYNNSYGNKVEQMLNDMEILVKAGVKVFLLDNLMSLDVDLFEGDKNNKQKGAILRIKEFAMTNMVHVLLVAHPRKVMTFLRKNDISGTSDITNAVDNVFIMHRTNTDFLKAITEFYNAQMAKDLKKYGNVLSVEKNRLYGVCDFMAGFYYDAASRRFKNALEEKIRYGWEKDGEQQAIDFTDSSQPPYSDPVSPTYSEHTEDVVFLPPTDEGVPF